MTELRDRIAAAAATAFWSALDESDCYCDGGFVDGVIPPQAFELLADAVIAELGLIRDPFSTVAFHRYVTQWASNGPDWKADDE